ncbi:conserved hypothetical protein [Anaeromyxobacter sp. K]|uniref:hypothetical protein n=1 Tax=Anaeromyxobacter sp. (strain K) TaxID=447217 RepID=UPI00015F99DB|nr:hypothetical protein [Anaeromyxobacter sp. K]ACG72862.1 conserved hypothetical protein [Anaeromyxobacter sp. K]
MRERPGARELEAAAAARPPPAGRARAPASEPLAMLVRRGLDPRLSRPDLPFDPALPAPALDAIAARLGHYAFRLFLRGAILAPAGFLPSEATRYVDAARARAMAEDCVALGLAERRPRGRYRLLRRARSFGGTLEWWVARELSSRLGLQVATGVRSGAPGVGGDLDVVAAAEGRLVYLELKSGPPKHLMAAEADAFVRRLRALRPDVALFAIDTALRLGDKVLPLLGRALVGPGGAAPEPRRVVRDTWALGPHLYVASAKEDLIENLSRALAEGLRALAPAPP